MNDVPEKNKLLHEIRSLLQLNCWAVVAGEGSGSQVSFSFGEKLLRKKPLSNPYLSESSRQYSGEYALYLEECSWRLESSSQVICGSCSSNSNDGVMVANLNMLVGAKVADINIDNPSMDLKILFDNGLSLAIFCNTLEAEDGDNYTFFSPKHNVTVTGYGFFELTN